MGYEIQKDIPPPSGGGGYPFAEMEVGDSFFAADKNANQLQNAASHWRKRMGWKFKTRTEGEGARIWRIE